MLPAAHRLRSSADFAHVIKAGRRAGRGRVVVHAAASRLPLEHEGARFGLVVGKATGNSVTRHRISRRLRAQLAVRLADVPSDVDVVVRALPAAATASSAELGRDLDAAFARVLGRTRS